MSFNVAGNVDNNSKPHTSQGTSGMIKNMYYATPFSSPGIVDGKFITTATDYNDERLPFTGGTGMAYYGAGFDKTSNNKLTADLMLDQKLDFITKGLSVKLKGSYNSGFVVTKTGRKVPLMLSVTVSDIAGRTLSGQTLDAFLASVPPCP